MKASLIYVLIAVSGMLGYAHTSSGQILDRRVSVGMDNEPLSVLFLRLEKQTGVSFAFSMEDPKAITFPIEDRTLKETLDLALSNSNYTYEVIHNTIAITKINKRNDQPGIASTSTAPILFTITGRVTDAITQEPIPGVNVVIKGTKKGTSTDNEGGYTLGVESGETLIFTFIGYRPVTLDVGNRSTIDVALEQDVAQLNEVVVNGGYYETTDRMKTGSIVKISSKDIERQPVTSPLMALQGRVPGLDISPNNGAAGGAAMITIRGENSLGAKKGAGSGYPLYVIDGVIIDSHPLETNSGVFYGLGNNGTGGIDPLANLNPNNIESIQVLKDADATSIYGSRGANGVIIITTKKASKGKERLTVEATYYQGIGKITKRIKLLNTAQYIDMRQEAFANDKLSPGPSDVDINGTWDKNRETDWQKVLLGGTAHITDAQLNLSGGSPTTTFRIGGSVHRETTIYPGNFGLKRGAGNFSLSHRSNNEKIKIDFSINYGIVRQNMFNTNLESAALLLPPNAPPLYNKDGTLNWGVINDNGVARPTFPNPMAGVLQTFDAFTKNLTTSGVMTYRISPDLIVKTSIGLTNTDGNDNMKTPITSLRPDTPLASKTGSSAFGSNTRSSWIIEPQISYSKQIGNHSITALMGTSLQQNESKRSLMQASGYQADVLLNTLKGATSFAAVEDTKSQYRYEAAFARLGYDFKSKYLFNLTGRRDGSSRFAPGNQFGNFGALGAAWILSEEKFIKSGVPLISFAKLRASYGTTGSDQVGDYSFYNLYKISAAKYQGQVALEASSLFNNNFRWEVTKKFEVALELNLLNDRISIESAWYRNRSSNQLIYYQIPSLTGFEAVLKNFDATVQNQGFEIALTTDNINTPNFTWTSSFNLTLPKNQLIRFPGIDESPYKDIYAVGKSLSIKKRYIWDGIDKVSGEHNIKDNDGSGTIDAADRIFSFPTDRQFYGGVTNSIRSKAWELSFLLQFSKRYIQYLPAVNPGYFIDRSGNQSVSVLNRWRADGDETSVAKYSTLPTNQTYYSTIVSESDYGITNTYFIRLKTISLSYSVPAKILERVRMEYLKIFIQGQNLMTLTNFKGVDPDVSGFGPTQLKMITAGIQLKF